MLTIDGLITGIDTASIIEGLQEVQQNQIDLLTARKLKLSTQQSAFKAIEAKLTSFRSQLGKLTRTKGNAFTGRSVQVGDESLLVATASSKAAVGSYQVRVDSLASNHQVATNGFVDADSTITSGTIDIRVGDGETTSFTIDGTNNTLQGLADSINFADAGVRASIIQDQSSPSAPFKLLLTADKTGASNEITITNNLAASSGGEVQPVFDTGNPVQEAADAVVALGSGPGAISVASETNQIDSLITGVTLNLLAADDQKSLTVNVSRDTESGVDAVQDLVDGYNDLLDFIDQQSKFEGESDTAGPLIGNRTVIELKDQVQAALLDTVPGLNTAANRLTSVGISVTDKGRLTLNATELESALRGEKDGVSPDDVRRLFALDGQSTSGQITFVLGSSKTKASESPYLVDISQAAERATISGTNALTSPTVIDSSNREFTISVDGNDLGTLTLSEGTYTATELADHFESVINTALPSGQSVDVGYENQRLTITSAAYGTSSKVAVTGGTALATLGFDGTESDSGRDVVGSFIVDGVSEPAKGTGRLLAGNSDNEHTADLQVRVTLGAGQVQPGHEAEISVTRGLASRLDGILDSMLKAETGRIATENTRFDDSVADIQESIEVQELRFTAQQESLIHQFVTLESLISELQTTGNFLASQLAGVSGLR